MKNLGNQMDKIMNFLAILFMCLFFYGCVTTKENNCVGNRAERIRCANDILHGSNRR
jgi:hypothetical protein